jgi:hypothetical protein
MSGSPQGRYLQRRHPRQNHPRGRPVREYRIGNRLVSRTTYYRHMQESREDIPSDSSSSEGSSPHSTDSSEPSHIDSSISSDESPIRPDLGPGSPRTSSPISVSDPLNSPPYHSPSDEAHDFDSHCVTVNMWEVGVGFVEGRIPEPTCHIPNLAWVIESEVVGLQSDLDAANVPISVQDKILQRLFKKRPRNQHEQPQDYMGMGLVQLVATAG